MCVLDLTFTDVMSSNITLYSRRNTTLTVSKKWTFNMKLCNLYYIILTMWTHIICAWTNPLSWVNICKGTGLTILSNKNPTFFLYFTVQFQLLDTQKKVIIFKSSSGNGSQISVPTKLRLTRKRETLIQFVEIYYFLSSYW